MPSVITLPNIISNGDTSDANKTNGNVNAIVNRYNTDVGAHSGDLVSTGELNTDTTLADDSDEIVSSQKAIKAYVDSSLPDSASATENVAGVDSAKFLTALANVPAFLKSLSANCIMNGDFVVNQRAYASNTTLAVGAFGHDRWKAGASGGDYTFTQLANSTQITIKSGKSLIQVIDTKDVVGGHYVLSWSGTAQARFGIDSATPSGAYAASPIKITTQTPGTVMSVEFNEGTLGKVVLNSGDVGLPFMSKGANQELVNCLLFFERLTPSAAGQSFAVGQCDSTTKVQAVLNYTPKRVNPAVSFSSGTNYFSTRSAGTGLAINGSALTCGAGSASLSKALIDVTGSGYTAGRAATVDFNSTSAYIDISADI